MTEQPEKKKRTIVEELEVQGNQLVDRVKEMIAEGNVRKVIIRNPDDSVLIEMSLTAATVAGGIVTLAAWPLAALGAIAALVARLKIEIVREIDEEEEPVKE